MPTLGQTVRRRELGLKGTGLLTLAECSNCGHQRFVRGDKLLPNYKTAYCSHCATESLGYKNHRIMKGSAHYKWKGGRTKSKEGYIYLTMQPDDFFYPMAKNTRGQITEHRLVMAKALGRSLHSWEIVHHRNHIRDDNRIENLQLVSDDRHNQISILERRIDKLETENKRLKSLLNLSRRAR